MKNARLALTFIATLLVSPAFARQSLDVRKMDSLFDVLETDNRMMGSVTLAKDGRIIYSRQVGYRELSDKAKRKSNAETKFRIGSITKVFTAVMIYQLIDEQKLTLETKLAKFFPRIVNADKISIMQLLSHRSGLPSYPEGVNYNDPKSWMFQPQMSQHMLERFIAMKPLFNPGEQYRYSNTNYALLGFIVESLTDSTYGEQLSRRIAKRIGLQKTHYGGRINSSGNEAHSFNYDDGKWKQSYEEDLSVPAGAGGIVSTTTDLTKFVSALFNNRLLKPDSLKEMTTSPADNLRQNGKGIGLFDVLDTKKKGFAHDGGIDAFRSLLAYVPEDGLAFAITINGHNYPTNKIFRTVLKIYYNQPAEIPSFNAIMLPPETLSQYEGTYVSKALGMTITIKREKEYLIAQASGQDPFQTEAISETTFSHQPSGILIEFKKDADGSVPYFTLYQQLGELRFLKKTAENK